MNARADKPLREQARVTFFSLVTSEHAFVRELVFVHFHMSVCLRSFLFFPCVFLFIRVFILIYIYITFTCILSRLKIMWLFFSDITSFYFHECSRLTHVMFCFCFVFSRSFTVPWCNVWRFHVCFSHLMFLSLFI